MVPQLIMQEVGNALANAGVKAPAGFIPLGLTKDKDGNAVCYYKGSEPPPAYLSEIDTLIGEPFSGKFEEREEGVEYFDSFDWDITKAGFIAATNYLGVDYKIYYTQHQPTIYSSSKDPILKRIWFRKIEATLEDKRVVSLWERFERD